MTSNNPDVDLPPELFQGSPPPSTTQNGLGSASYKRAYKACESCRKNKAKCEVDVGSVACVKCQRERRQCVFPAHRSSKRRRLSGIRKDSNAAVSANDEQHSQARRDSRLPPPLTSEDRNHTDTSVHQSAQQDEASNANARRRSATSYSPQSVSDLGREVLQTAVTSSRDAMGLLFRAAAEEPDDLQDTDAETHAGAGGSRFGGSIAAAGISPEGITRLCLPTETSRELVEIWSKHRFVRQGWFSPYEAIAFIEFFFQKLAPLSPVAESFHLDRAHHRKFVYDEPLLCCTILCISSRHMSLPGPTGATHSAHIHARLWKHIEHLVQRITFGTEKLSSAKSRTLGSIQALLLIIEWHPRSLHFPPDNDGWDASLGPTADDTYQPQTKKADAMNRWRDDVFEPAKRSDRMSWTLVGLATTLAHELGVFGGSEDDIVPDDLEVFLCTRPRIRKLLYFFTTQLSLRLGCTNIFPRGDQIATSRLPGTVAQSADQMRHNSEVALSQWCSITKLLDTATQMFFESTSMTRQIISSFRYLDMLEYYRPPLARWLEEFEGVAYSIIPQASRQIILIEYHYVNVFVNSVAIQALVERINTNSCSDVWMQQDFLRRENAQDLQSIKIVRESSGEILGIARKLSDDGFLTYCPVRVFLRIVAASIFLLKAISLGAKEADASASLRLLENCIEALMSRRDEDIHLSSRYADLIARHVRSFKRNLRPSRRKKFPETTNSNAIDENGGSAQPLAVANEPSTAHVGQQLDNNSQTQAGGPTVAAASSDMQTQFPDTAASIQNTVTNYNPDADSDIFDWLVQPFDPKYPPFGLETSQPASGLAIDSLDFLWNL